MNAKKGAAITNLPLELLIEILLRVPVKSLIRFKCVSKSWCDQINSPDFIRQHLSRSLEASSSGSVILYGGSSLVCFDFHNANRLAIELHYPFKDLEHIRSPKLLGSCNGLLCFRFNYYQFVLYNPATRAYKEVPLMGKTFRYFSIRGEFAYDFMSDDYKVLRFVRYYRTLMKIDLETHIYSLKANSWETIPNPPWGLNFASSRSVVVNNSLHWIGYDDGNSEVIRCFDLFTHGYDEMPLPKEVGPSPRLAVLKGYLHVITERIDIWVMKEYGVTKSWTQLFHCLPRQCERIFSCFYGRWWPLPYAYSKDGRRILVGVEEKPENFICCDLDYQVTSKVEILGLPIGTGGLIAEPWVESLVPLV